MQKRVWIVSELYYPEKTSTGHLLTLIAEGLAQSFDVKVLCAQPTYSARGVTAPPREVRNDVDIQRCSATTLDKNVLLFRLINLTTISISIFFQALRQIKKEDYVLVVTNPPLLPFLTAFTCWLRGSKCMLLIHDVYPEVLVAAGVSDPDSMLVRGLNWLSQRLYRSMDRIVVLGRDMETLALNKLETDLDRVVIIPNWADIDQIYPADRAENELLRETNLQDKFVIQYAGNMGRTHNLEGVVAAAQRLQTEQPNVHFLFIGSGAKRQWLEDTITAQRVDNIILLSPRPRSDQHNFLNACDATIISFVPGMAGISVPSRMYNIMASGKPIFAIADDHSELAQVVREEDIGWVIPPSQPEKLVAAIAEAQGDPTRLADMGRRARLAVEHKYTLPHIIAAYERMIREMD